VSGFWQLGECGDKVESSTGVEKVNLTHGKARQAKFIDNEFGSMAQLIELYNSTPTTTALFFT
jgi:hypothetical protein